MFRYEHMTLTQLGELFGVSCQQIGRWLVALGLRTSENRPSNKAFQGDYVKQGPSRGSGYNWVWHSEKTVTTLQKAGHKRIPNPPLFLADPPKLNGPFQTRVNDNNGIDIVSADNSVAIVVTGNRNAEFVVQVLNIAHRNGVIERHMGTAMPEPTER